MSSKVRILLINPVQYEPGKLIPKYRLGSIPPTNVLSVAGLLRTYPDVDVKVVDEFIDEIPFDEPFDWVGVSTTFTSTFPRAVDISRAFRHRGIPVVMGGTHVTCNPETSAAHADCLVVGEAEHNVPELMQDFLATRTLKPVYRQDAMVDFARCQPTIPAYELVDLNRYMRIGLVQKTHYFALETSRGCPMPCDFCAVRLTHGSRLRFKPISQVLAEVRTAKQRYGVRLFSITDDNFLLNEARSREILEALAPEGIRFFCEASTHILHKPHLLPLLKKAGCISLFIGFESVNQDNMSLVHKNHNKVSEYREIFRLLEKHEIPVVASFMLGLDGDDESVFDRTITFLDSVNVRRAMVAINTPLPGTATYQRYLQEGRILTDDLSLYDGCHVVFQPKRMSAAQLQSGWRDMQRRHYAWPSIFRRLRKTRSRDLVYTFVTNALIRNHVYHDRVPYHSGIKRIAATPWAN